MARSGSFGVNYKKSFGTDPAIVEAKLGDIGTDPDGEWMYVKAGAAVRSNRDFWRFNHCSARWCCSNCVVDQ